MITILRHPGPQTVRLMPDSTQVVLVHREIRNDRPTRATRLRRHTIQPHIDPLRRFGTKRCPFRVERHEIPRTQSRMPPKPAGPALNDAHASGSLFGDPPQTELSSLNEQKPKCWRGWVDEVWRPHVLSRPIGGSIKPGRGIPSHPWSGPDLTVQATVGSANGEGASGTGRARPHTTRARGGDGYINTSAGSASSSPSPVQESACTGVREPNGPLSPEAFAVLPSILQAYALGSQRLRCEPAIRQVQPTSQRYRQTEGTRILCRSTQLLPDPGSQRPLFSRPMIPGLRRCTQQRRRAVPTPRERCGESHRTASRARFLLSADSHRTRRRPSAPDASPASVPKSCARGYCWHNGSNPTDLRCGGPDRTRRRKAGSSQEDSAAARSPDKEVVPAAAAGTRSGPAPRNAAGKA
ncbi:hypothetical protein ACVWXU_006063 [Streptomyces sp. TE33382]